MKTRRMLSGAKSVSQASTTMSLTAADNMLCIFCGEEGNKKDLRKAATLGLDSKVRQCAQVLGDRKLLAKLSSSDLVAL